MTNNVRLATDTTPACGGTGKPVTVKGPTAEELGVPSAHEAFEADGSLRDPDLRSGLAEIVEQLAQSARRALAPAA